jgi:hypothetical protein
MEPKTKSQIEKEANAYLAKTSLHLFTTGTEKHLYKIITFEQEGKRYYATIHFLPSKVAINVQEVVSDRQFAYYGNNTLDVLKKSLFPRYYVTQSIPNFKKMKVLIADIQKDIKVDSKSNLELAERVRARLGELVQVK